MVQSSQYPCSNSPKWRNQKHSPAGNRRSNIIGWDNFMKGRAASSRTYAQMQYVLVVDWNHKKRDFNQDQWSTQLVTSK
eukprot:619309-Ditylum_brightwellii.AAC.1